MKPPKGKVLIYGLRDPETKDVRYVGKTKTDIRHRLQAHLCEKGDTRKVRWVAILKQRGLVPEPFIIEVVDEEKWEERECYWIAYYRELGYDLTNLTDGGDGLHNPSLETRQKLSVIQQALYSDPQYRARMIEAIQSAERRAKLSKALANRKKSPEHVAKLPQNQQGYKHSEEFCRRQSKAQGGKKRPGQKVSPQMLEVARLANIGNQHTKGRVMPEHEKLQRSLANQGQERSEGTKAKQSLARSQYWERRRQEGGDATMLDHSKAVSEGKRRNQERRKQEKETSNGITLQGLWDTLTDDSTV